MFFERSITVTAFTSLFAVHISSAQAISVAIFTKVEFDEEEYDDNSEYDHETTYQWKCKNAGKYHFGSAIGMNGISNGEKLEIALLKNGDTTMSKTNEVAGGDGLNDVSICGDFELEVDNTVEVVVHHNIGGDKNTGIDARCRFWGHRIA